MIFRLTIALSKPTKVLHSDPSLPRDEEWQCCCEVKKLSLHTMPQVGHQAPAYTGFLNMKLRKYSYTPLDEMLVHPRVTPSIKFFSVH